MPRLTQCRENVSIDFAGENHLRHFQRRVVGYAPAFDDRLLDAQFFRQFAELFAAAMDNADTNSDLMQQGQLFRQRS